MQADVETCDDANADQTDACTTLCAAPSCMDKLKSGAETDVDCGGANCPDCELAQACAGPSDCKSGTCDGGLCVLAPSCKALKALLPVPKDGLYWVNLGGTSTEVYCERALLAERGVHQHAGELHVRVWPGLLRRWLRVRARMRARSGRHGLRRR